MKEEIKEILDTKLYFDLEEEDYIKIKNYITDLQEENERLKKELSRIIEIVDLNQYNYGYQIKEEITSGGNDNE